jgi:hypothetical protein
MKRCILPVLSLLLGLFSFHATPGATEDADLRETFRQEKFPTFSGSLRTFFLWKNDRDFDDTEPLFNEYGQSVGYMDVTLFPRLTWDINRSVRVQYYAEVGKAFWSRSDQEPIPEVVETRPVYIQKELWTQIYLPWKGYGTRVGFQYVHDPTLLFLEKYVGALHAFYRDDSLEVRFTALQVPDTVYEGFSFEENNFQNDNFVFALDTVLPAWQETRLQLALFFQWDRTDVNRPKLLWAPCVNFALDLDRWGTWELDAVLEAGRWQNQSINNRDLDILAGALQIHGSFSIGRAALESNLLFLSPDDGDPHNGLDTGFQYSGLSKSRTLILTQNWIMDQYDNLDEKAAISKAGALIASVFCRLPLAKTLEAFGVTGYGMVLEKRFAGGGRTLGAELDAGLFWHLAEAARVIVLGGVFVPGEAGGALQNEILLTADDSMYYSQAAVEVTF